MPLFNRIGRKLKLNQYGIDFLHTTNNIVGEMEIYKNQVAHDTNIESGKLTIGFLHSVGVTYISDFLKAFKKKFPNVRLKLIQNHAKNC